MAARPAQRYLEHLMQQEMASIFSSEFKGVQEKEITPFMTVMRIIKSQYAANKPEVYRTLIAVLHDYNPALGVSARNRTVKYIKSLLDIDTPELSEYLINILPPCTNDPATKTAKHTLHVVRCNDGKSSEATDVVLDSATTSQTRTTTEARPVKFYNYTPPAVNAYVASQGVPTRVVSTLPAGVSTSSLANSVHLVAPSINIACAPQDLTNAQTAPIGLNGAVVCRPVEEIPVVGIPKQLIAPKEGKSDASVVNLAMSPETTQKITGLTTQLPITILSSFKPPTQDQPTRIVFSGQQLTGVEGSAKQKKTKDQDVTATEGPSSTATKVNPRRTHCIVIQPKPKVADTEGPLSPTVLEGNPVKMDVNKQSKYETRSASALHSKKAKRKNTLLKDKHVFVNKFKGTTNDNQDDSGDATNPTTDGEPKEKISKSGTKAVSDFMSDQAVAKPSDDEEKTNSKLEPESTNRNSSVFPYSQQILVFDDGKGNADGGKEAAVGRNEGEGSSSGLVEDTPLRCLEKMVTLAKGISMDPFYMDSEDSQNVACAATQDSPPPRTPDKNSEDNDNKTEETMGKYQVLAKDHYYIDSSQGSKSSNEDMFFYLNHGGGTSDHSPGDYDNRTSPRLSQHTSDVSSSELDMVKIPVTSGTPPETTATWKESDEEVILSPKSDDKLIVSPKGADTDVLEGDRASSPTFVWAPTKRLIPWKIAKAQDRNTRSKRRLRKSEK